MNPSPCPFCGGPVIEGHGRNPDSRYFLYVMCRACTVYMKGHDREELVGRWNARDPHHAGTLNPPEVDE